MNYFLNLQTFYNFNNIVLEFMNLFLFTEITWNSREFLIRKILKEIMNIFYFPNGFCKSWISFEYTHNISRSLTLFNLRTFFWTMNSFWIDKYFIISRKFYSKFTVFVIWNFVEILNYFKEENTKTWKKMVEKEMKETGGVPHLRGLHWVV